LSSTTALQRNTWVHVIAPRSSAPPDWCCSLSAYFVRRICNPIFCCTASGAFGAFVDGVVRHFAYCRGIVMAKAPSWNRSLAVRVLVVDLFKFSNRGCLFAGRHIGSGQLHNAVGRRNCPWKRSSGSSHQDGGILIRTDWYCFFHADSLGPSHRRHAIAKWLDAIIAQFDAALIHYTN